MMVGIVIMGIVLLIAGLRWWFLFAVDWLVQWRGIDEVDAIVPATLSTVFVFGFLVFLLGVFK